MNDKAGVMKKPQGASGERDEPLDARKRNKHGLFNPNLYDITVTASDGKSQVEFPAKTFVAIDNDDLSNEMKGHIAAHRLERSTSPSTRE